MSFDGKPAPAADYDTEKRLVKAVVPGTLADLDKAAD
jgi:hypothetical protein